MPSTTPTPRPSNYQELVQLVRELGYFERASGRILTELGLHLFLHLAPIAVVIWVDNLLVDALALLVSTYGGLGIATNTHTSSHFATSRHRGLDRGLTYFGYTFLFGTPASYWWNKHCMVHHPAPNMIGIDADADLMPFFALNLRERAASCGFARWFYQVQWVVVPFLLALNTFFTQYQGWRFLLARLRDPALRRRGHGIDVLVGLLHVLAWIVLPMLVFAPMKVLTFYVVRNALMGYAMFIAFAPAHFPEEAAFLDARLAEDDFVLRQCAGSINFRTGFWGSLACAGVQYQIEHHLIPGVPHIYYPRISPIVEAYCRRKGYPYCTLGWWEATWKSLVVFYRPKPIIDEFETLCTTPDEDAR